jgi:hypothetical protein
MQQSIPLVCGLVFVLPDRDDRRIWDVKRAGGKTDGPVTEVQLRQPFEDPGHWDVAMDHALFDEGSRTK